MASEDLKPFSYVVLALIGDRGAGAHDIVGMMRRGQMYWAAAESQWYAEPKRLVQLGYLSARRTPGRTTDRTHYRLTAKGRRALQGWLAQAARFPRMQNEASVRLLAGDLIDDATLASSLTAMRDELDELEASFEQREAIAKEIPERTRYLLLNHRLGRRLVATYREWLDEVERELTPPDH
jgi:PadR family transcriptional regulator, regulatory protein AphA